MVSQDFLMFFVSVSQSVYFDDLIGLNQIPIKLPLKRIELRLRKYCGEDDFSVERYQF